MTQTDMPDFQTIVKPEWIDANGHMNVAYYVAAFDLATDHFYEHLGLSWDYLEAQQKSLFTLGMNVDYAGEVFEGDPLRITTRLIDHSDKCLHYFHEMYHADRGYLSATNECLALHVSMETRRGLPFEADQMEMLAKLMPAKEETLPDAVGRSLKIRRS